LPQFKCFYWQPLFELALVSKEFVSASRSMFCFINILDLLIIFFNFSENLKIFKMFKFLFFKWF
jgi:hypothetical protein